MIWGMGLRLADRWVWDFWFASDGNALHVFFLQACRSLGDPDIRHDHTSVGHAVTTDLQSWAILPDAFTVGPPGAWDDRAIWTGSIFRAVDRWHFFYTGRGDADGGRVQRIGRATSTDLVDWERVGDGPLLEADPRWYEREDRTAWHEVAWRDPWILADPAGDGYHALITARSKDGDPATRGVLAHATSPDLAQWTAGTPLPSPEGFGHLEVPQVVDIDGRTYLVWCTQAEFTGPDRRAGGHARTGTYIVQAPSLLGPFHVPLSTSLQPYTDHYAGRLVPFRGSWYVLGFIDRIDGSFVGELADFELFEPARVTVTAGAPAGG